MKEKLQAIREDAISKITASDNLDKLNQIRVEVLGKKGQLTEVLKGMKDVAPEDRPKVGQLVNDTRKIIEEKRSGYSRNRSPEEKDFTAGCSKSISEGKGKHAGKKRDLFAGIIKTSGNHI